MFDYQKQIFDAIENNQNIWILKSQRDWPDYFYDYVILHGKYYHPQS